VPLFAYRDEADPERVRSRASENETASLDSADLCDVVLSPPSDQRGDNLGKRVTVVKDAPDIGVSSLPSEATKERLSACTCSGTHPNRLPVLVDAVDQVGSAGAGLNLDSTTPRTLGASV